MFSSFSRSSKRYIPLLTPLLVGRVVVFAACDKEVSEEKKQSLEGESSNNQSSTVTEKQQQQPVEKEELYHGMFPVRQLWKPSKEYPLWDANWDQRQPHPPLEKREDERARQRKIRKEGVTRHLILVRHGQYDETHKEDEKRILTELGREQAHLTGKRLAELLRQTAKHESTNGGDDDDENPGGDDDDDPLRCNIRVVRVSNLARAKETAALIAQHLPDGVVLAEPDPLLNEGKPAHTVPSPRPVSSSSIEKWDEHHPRIEEAFQKYVHRREYQEPSDDDDDESDDNTNSSSKNHKHEYEIIVCHANLIRYFVCRALQLPPEAWLRFCNFNCSLTYLTIRPTGSVSLRMFGDIGHLPYEKSTFSQHEGFNW